MAVTAGRHKLIIEQGATLRRTLTWRAAGVPVDLSGYTAAALLVLTSSRRDANTLIALSLGAGITLGGVAGTIVLLMTDEQTETLPVGEWVWRLELTPPDGAALRLLEGPAVVR